MDTRLADPLLGRLLDGRYRVESLIAQGGMATVYLGIDTRLDRRVALKVMHADLARDEEFVRRFIGEAKSVARLSDPNVVAVFDQGSDGEHLYLAMEYVPGQTLRQLLDARQRFGPLDALGIMVPLLSGLAAAHRSGIVHRDVKPENVLVGRDGQVKVVDFGLARALTGGNQTRSGLIMGTAAYLAPEQVAGTGTDTRTDVYAAGIVLFELLTGGQPYRGDTPLAVAYQHVHQDVPAPSTLASGVPPAVDRLVAMATSRDPRRRPADAAALLGAVRQLSGSLSAGDTDPVVDAGGATTDPIGHTDSALGRLPEHAPGHGRTLVGSRGGTLVAPRGGFADLPDGRRGGEWRIRSGRWLMVLAAAMLAAAGAGTWWLTEGRYASVPAVAGMTSSAATAVLHTDGFTVRSAAPVPDNTVRKGRVVRTVPAAGGRVPQGSAVTLVASAGPRLITIPPVAGESLAGARNTLLGAGLTPSGHVGKAVSSSVAAGLVIGTRPAAGTSWPQPRPVVITVSEGPPLPDFVGQAIGVAQSWAAGHPGVTVNPRQAASAAQPPGIVFQQSPGPGTPVSQGETVTVLVSTGPPQVGVPNVTGMTVEAARATLRKLGFVVRVNRFGPFDTVFAYSPAGQAAKGSTITVYAGL